MPYKYTKAFSAWGAQMGRPEIIQEAETVKKLHLERVYLQDGGCYDPGGAYWGMGEPLYVAWGEGETEQQEMFLRASSREEAKEECKEVFTNAKFYR